MITKVINFTTLLSAVIFAQICLSSVQQVRAATQIELQPPTGSREFGETVKALPNGNIVVTDSRFTPDSFLPEAGAVHLFNGRTGALINSIIGTHAYTRVGASPAGVVVLTNGNYVVRGGVWVGNNNSFSGGAILCDKTVGCGGTMDFNNSLYGKIGDGVSGDGIVPLATGNYLVVSSSWDNGAIIDVGAVTFCSGTTGCVGAVSAANSLIGSNANDQTGGGVVSNGRGIVTFPNGNYAVANKRWNGNRGAVTFGSGTSGVTGVVSTANSLVGTNAGDEVSNGGYEKIGVTVLTNNNYVVSSITWNGNRGAATFCHGTTGCTGTVSESNSLYGVARTQSSQDVIGSRGIVTLTNGNYVVVSDTWNGSRGAATWGDGTNGSIGAVTVENSIVGTQPLGAFAADYVGNYGVIPLTNGNYLVRSPSWGFDAFQRSVGAVTWGNGATGTAGAVSQSNSLTGNILNDKAGDGWVHALANGNYVVGSPTLSNQISYNVGAVTWGNGTTGIVGRINASNSLIGDKQGDRLGSFITPLTNGNYVVNSPFWNHNSVAAVGAVTWVNGLTGMTGAIRAENSLIGSSPSDQVGISYDGTKALTNGNYVVVSTKWNGERGAVTWGNGATGTTGVVSAQNSLVGSNVGDEVGNTSNRDGFLALSNGNYVVGSPFWKNGAAARAGAITFGNGTSGTSGAVSPANSVVGVRENDQIGGNYSSKGLFALTNGGYVAVNTSWDNGNVPNAGVITLGKSNSPLTGVISNENSVLGTFQNLSPGRMSYDYDYKYRQLIVGRLDSGTVTLLRYENPQTLFDYDGDGKADVSVFRPSSGAWYLNRSTAGIAAVQFGTATDKIAPADYDGDGKTDIAVFRDGIWYLQQTQAGFVSLPFGSAGDLTVSGDFDGDTKADLAVWRPATGDWYRVHSSNGQFVAVQFGTTGDKPQVGDFDGDGKTDIAVFRPSNGAWYLQQSTAGFRAVQFGASNDVPNPADFDGDGKTDVAVFRPETGAWYRINSSDNSFFAVQFGANGDIPAAADFDGDGKADVTVLRPSSGAWYQNRSSGGFFAVQFGANGDIPTPAAFGQR